MYTYRLRPPSARRPNQRRVALTVPLGIFVFVPDTTVTGGWPESIGGRQVASFNSPGAERLGGRRIASFNESRIATFQGGRGVERL